VLRDGRLAGLWRVKARGTKAEITVEKLGRLTRRDLAEEARRAEPPKPRSCSRNARKRIA